MTLTVLLILAGFAASDEAPARATTARKEDAPPATIARTDSFIQAVRKRLSVARPTPLLVASPFVSSSPDSEESTERQLTNRRTGVTCTMRIVPIQEPVDPGAVGDRNIVDARPPDAMVRNDVSPCIDGGGALNAGRRR
jgi:hypothetical protein